MKVNQKIKTIFSLNFKTAILLFEAFCYLGWARILISFSFSKYACSLGIQMEETPLEFQANHAILKDISSAVHIMSRHTLWESKCLVRAIAGLKMLERRRIDCTLYLGTTRENNTGNMIAHAWLRSGLYYITGAEEMERFTVVGKFAKRYSSQKEK